MVSPSRFRISTATPLLLQVVAAEAREADVAELWASAHLTPPEVVELAEKLSPEVFIGWLDDTPICAFGVTPISTITGHGSPWMVGTNHLDSCAAGFLKASRLIIFGMLRSWPVLTNFVDARNERAIRWLKWLGFTIFPAAPHGLDGLDFHRFEMRSEHV